MRSTTPSPSSAGCGRPASRTATSSRRTCSCATGGSLLIDVAFATVRPTPWRQAVDLANMMLTLALASDAELVYERAIRMFAPDDVAEAFAASRSVTIPTQLRARLRADGRDLIGTVPGARPGAAHGADPAVDDAADRSDGVCAARGGRRSRRGLCVRAPSGVPVKRWVRRVCDRRGRPGGTVRRDRLRYRHRRRPPVHLDRAGRADRPVGARRAPTCRASVRCHKGGAARSCTYATGRPASRCSRPQPRPSGPRGAGRDVHHRHGDTDRAAHPRWADLPAA